MPASQICLCQQVMTVDFGETFERTSEKENPGLIVENMSAIRIKIVPLVRPVKGNTLKKFYSGERISRRKTDTGRTC